MAMGAEMLAAGCHADVDDARIGVFKGVGHAFLHDAVDGEIARLVAGRERVIDIEAYRYVEVVLLHEGDERLELCLEAEL